MERLAGKSPSRSFIGQNEKRDDSVRKRRESMVSYLLFLELSSNFRALVEEFN